MFGLVKSNVVCLEINFVPRIHVIPISDLGSYVTVGEEFKSHWTDVNADRVAGGGTVLLLADGYSLVTLTADVGSVGTAITGQEDLDNARALATTNRDNRKQTLRDRLMEFRDAVPLSGGWNAATGQAEFHWLASTELNLVAYELRMSPGSTYDAGKAAVWHDAPRRESRRGASSHILAEKTSPAAITL